MKQIICILVLIIAFPFIAVNGNAMEIFGTQIHGFLSQGYMNTTENNFFGDTMEGTFEFHEVGINLIKEVTDSLWVGGQLISRDFGAYGNNDLVLDWAVLDYCWKDWLVLRGGKLKAPKGLYNETRDMDMLRPNIFLPQSVYPEILREMDLSLVGGGIYGNISPKDWGGFSYLMIYGTQDVSANEAASQALQGTTATETPVENDSIDVDYKFAASLVYDTPLEGLRLSGTFDTSRLAAIGHSTEGDTTDQVLIADFDRYENTVFSVEYSIGKAILVAEYIRTKKELEHSFSGTTSESPTEMPGGDDTPLPDDGGGPEDNIGPDNGDISSSTEDVTADGWYAGIAYQFTDWFQLSGYYSESYNDISDRSGDHLFETSHRAYFKDVCLTTGFIINDAWHIKVEGHRFRGTGGISPIDQVPDELGQTFSEKEWLMFAAKVTFNF